jgi:hypothetical protein
MASRMILVKTETYEMLRDLATRADTTIVAALEKAVREYHRRSIGRKFTPAMLA